MSIAPSRVMLIGRYSALGSLADDAVTDLIKVEAGIKRIDTSEALTVARALLSDAVAAQALTTPFPQDTAGLRLLRTLVSPRLRAALQRRGAVYPQGLRPLISEIDAVLAAPDDAPRLRRLRERFRVISDATLEAAS